MINQNHVAGALSRSPIADIAFRAPFFGISGSDYGVVASRIRLGHVRFEELPASAGVSALYSFASGVTDSGFRHAADTFYLKASFGVTAPHDIALLAHEATHAIQDLRRMRRNHLTVPQAETAAYLAQTLCFRLIGRETFTEFSLRRRAEQNRPPPLGPARVLLDHLERVAEIILAGEQPEAGDFENIRSLVALHPVYAPRRDVHPGFNGIRSHHAG